jgi:ferritin-like metal-binding protein YciE
MYRNRDPTGNVTQCKEVAENAPSSITSSDAGKAAFSSNGQHMKALNPMRTRPSSQLKSRMQAKLEKTRASITRTVDGILMLDGSPKQHTTVSRCTKMDSYIT